MTFLEVSAKSALNIEKTFTSISKQVMDRMANSNFKDNKTGGVKIGAQRTNNTSSGNGYKNSKPDENCC